MTRITHRMRVAVLAATLATAGALAAAAPAASASTPSADAVHAGAMLFTGQTRLSGGGAACISCHSAASPQVGIRGGNFAIGLTAMYTNLGGDAGIRAMVITPPFPPMAAAYQNHPVTDAEATQLIAFLKASSDAGAAGSASSGGAMLLAGLVGLGAILGLMHLIWRGRKSRGTKQAIYERPSRVR